jgi:hypothetical protein
MIKEFWIISTACLLLLLMTACSTCSTCRPVLYPNKHYHEVGEKQAQKDIQSAIEIAKKQGLDDTSASSDALARSASKTAAHAGVNTAASVATGTVGVSSAAGAASSGLGLLIDWMFAKKQPRPLFRKHVELTLRKQGYQVLGWK